MFWAETGMLIDGSSTQFALVITKMPLPDPAGGFTCCLSTYRRPAPDQAPTHVNEKSSARGCRRKTLVERLLRRRRNR
jgi:hypothetical protein